MTLADSSACQRCGNRLENGKCTACAGLLETAPSNPFVERVKQFLRLQSNQPELVLGSYELIDKAGGEHYALANPLTQIGRDRTNAVCCPNDTAVSRLHAGILFANGAYWLEDMGSTNGTLLNGRKVGRRQRLSVGDLIGIGRSQYVIAAVAGSNDLDFGQYEIISEIGRGGMGVVYQARDKKSRRIVAVKKLSLDNLDPVRKDTRFKRFKREATLAAQLKHPNIVTVYDYKIRPENSYYVMEFIEGPTLRKYGCMEKGYLTPAEYLPILRQIASALTYAHKMKVTHRDVKPDNIFVEEDGTVKLTDFGIATASELEPTNITKSGAMLGTLFYVSPEQLNNAKRVDHRADIFSLGVVSYELLSGQVPFKGQGIMDTMANIVGVQETPLNTVMSAIPERAAAVIHKAMRKSPQDRFSSAEEFAERFEESLAETYDP